MPTIDTDLYDALTAANVPADKARAAAAALKRRLSEGQVDLVTNAELGAAVDRLENRIESEVNRLESRIAAARTELGTEIKALDAKLDRTSDSLREQMAHAETRFERLLWRHTVTIILAVVAVVGLMLRAVR